MNKPSKCKNCQWYGKPYWSIINPCDNCPRENTNVEIITRWQDPTIKELQNQLQQKENIIKEAREYIENNIVINFDKVGFKTDKVAGIVIDKLLEILDKENK